MRQRANASAPTGWPVFRSTDLRLKFHEEFVSAQSGQDLFAIDRRHRRFAGRSHLIPGRRRQRIAHIVQM
jgi:hypothetical protein